MIAFILLSFLSVPRIVSPEADTSFVRPTYAQLMEKCNGFLATQDVGEEDQEASDLTISCLIDETEGTVTLFDRGQQFVAHKKLKVESRELSPSLSDDHHEAKVVTLSDARPSIDSQNNVKIAQNNELTAQLDREKSYYQFAIFLGAIILLTLLSESILSYRRRRRRRDYYSKRIA